MACESTSGKILIGKCCPGGLTSEFVIAQTLRVFVNDFSNTGAENVDWAESYIDAYDMNSIQPGWRRQETFSDIGGVPVTIDDIEGSTYTAGAIGTSRGDARISVGRSIVISGPSPSACRVKRRRDGEIIECEKNLTPPIDVKALPDLNETSLARSEIRHIVFFPPFELTPGTIPSCCNDAP